jgi:hypothetical protein
MSGLTPTFDRTGARSVLRLESIVAIGGALLVLLSIVMFMLNNTSATVSTLIAGQNDACLKLRENLDYYEHHRSTAAGADPSLPPGLFESVVEVSRTNASLMKAVHRLNLVAMFSSWSSLDEIMQHLRPTDRAPPAPGQAPYFDHFGVDPRSDGVDPKTNTAIITEQGMYQIELYQAIRDYAQDEASFYKEFLGALSVYMLPVLYGLLGASLWEIRSASCRNCGSPALEFVDRSSRFVMAAIAGIALSVVGTLVPNQGLLSPAALAFLFGYSVDVFIVRLDRIIAGLVKRDPQ